MAEDEDIITPETTVTAGQRLRAAREDKGLSLEDVATQTRIPRRHLEAIEEGDWGRLPAPTYTIGFAKSYATAIGIDRNQIADDIRAEMGGARPVSTTTVEVFEPADPARTMPKWLVLGALAAIIIVVLVMTWLNSRALDGGSPAPEAQQEVAAAPSPTAVQPAAPAAATAGAVVLTAAEPVWLQVYERGGTTLFQGEMVAGQRYEVPASATEPLLRTGKPEAIRVTVGDEPAPPIGPPARTISDVSLRAADLMGSGAAVPAIPAASAPPGVQNRSE